MVSSAKSGRRAVAGLLALSFIPSVAGAVRVAELTAGAEITADNARFFTAPAIVVAHIVTVTVYAVLGAFQFAPRLRRRHPGWHRIAGRLLVLSGLGCALTGIWLTLFLPRPDDTGNLLSGIRLVVGVAIISCIGLGFAAIRRRDIARHRAWMIRGYAIAMGAGTQAITQVPLVIASGPPAELPKALLMAAAWLINLAVAEWIIRRRPARRRTAAQPTTPAITAAAA